MAIYGIQSPPGNRTGYYKFDGELGPGDQVVAQTEHGPGVGAVTSGPITLLPGAQEQELPLVLRRATAEDLDLHAKNLELARQAKAFCKDRIRARHLDMKLVEVEIFFDRSKFIFYFTAPARIDFRELVKDLVREYRARIELRQIGVRHETQMIGAIGNCGQVCCCRRHLRKFAPVTIRMAKEQNLFLNPAKISGICGRLLCCLSYEQDNYEKFRRESPRPGKKYQTAAGLLKVLRVNMFRNTLVAVNEDNQEAEYTLEEWKELKPWRSAHDLPDSEEDAAAGRSW